MTADVLRHGDRGDDLGIPVAMAIGLHVALLLALVLAGWLQRPPEKVSVAGPVVEATLMIEASDIAAAERTMEEAPKPPEPLDLAPPPQPEPVTAPQDEPEPIQPTPQEQLPDPDTVDQEAVARLAEQAAEAERQRIQEERIQQDQVDLTERLRQQQAEARRRQRQQQLEDLRREREDAERRTKMEEQRLAQLADRERPTPPARTEAPPATASGNDGTDTDLRARYALALQQAISRNWNRPETVSPGALCPLRIIQARGGTVISAEVLPGCVYDTLGQRSVEAAVLKAQPLPYAGFESVFERDIKLNFRAPEN